jgi:CrcB protein
MVVGIGGFLGANARYLITVWIMRQFHERYGLVYPLGTLAVNVIGSLLLAVFIGLAARRIELAPNIRLLIGTGFFGAFTTFSTFANETVLLAQQGNWIAAAGHMISTNLFCLVGVVLGLAIANRL